MAGRLDVNTTSATIGGLETGATYDVRLFAGNADGWLSAVVSPTLRVVVSSGVDGNGDGMPEDWAAANGVTDGSVDGDGDGLTNAAEYQLGSEPLEQDSDGDGYSDGEEQAAGSDALDGASYGGAYLQPRLVLGDDQLHFKAKLQAGGEAPAQSVAWANAGGGSLTLQAAGDQGWIVPSVVGGDVQVAVATAGLKPGFYSGVVRLSAAGGAPLMGDPACIRVNTWVLPADNDVAQEQGQVIDFAPLPGPAAGRGALHAGGEGELGAAGELHQSGAGGLYGNRGRGHASRRRAVYDLGDAGGERRVRAGAERDSQLLGSGVATGDAGADLRADHQPRVRVGFREDPPLPGRGRRCRGRRKVNFRMSSPAHVRPGGVLFRGGRTNDRSGGRMRWSVRL